MEMEQIWVGQKDHNCIATRTFEYDGHLEGFFLYVAMSQHRMLKDNKQVNKFGI